MRTVLVLLAGLLLLAAPSLAADSRYLEDFEFVRETVAGRFAALKSKGIAWAITETERAVSIGRPTGGWGIIPRGFSCPSGLVSFRLGVNDRPTPIRGIHTEGAGWPPDVLIPYGPVVRARPDSVLEVGLEVLRVLHAEVPRDKAAALFGGLFSGEVEAFEKGAGRLAKVEGFEPKRFARLVTEDIETRLAMEAALLSLDDAGPPDALGAARRLATLAPRAKAADLKGPLARLEKAVERLKTEASAAEDFLAITDRGFQAPEDERKRFLSRHKRTAIARHAVSHLWQ